MINKQTRTPAPALTLKKRRRRVFSVDVSVRYRTHETERAKYIYCFAINRRLNVHLFRFRDHPLITSSPMSERNPTPSPRPPNNPSTLQTHARSVFAQSTPFTPKTKPRSRQSTPAARHSAPPSLFPSSFVCVRACVRVCLVYLQTHTHTHAHETKQASAATQLIPSASLPWSPAAALAPPQSAGRCVHFGMNMGIRIFHPGMRACARARVCLRFPFAEWAVRHIRIVRNDRINTAATAAAAAATSLR